MKSFHDYRVESVVLSLNAIPLSSIHSRKEGLEVLPVSGINMALLILVTLIMDVKLPKATEQLMLLVSSKPCVVCTLQCVSPTSSIIRSIDCYKVKSNIVINEQSTTSP